MYKISVAGAGFVGIVHAAVMANQGHKVILFDIDPKKINHLNSNQVIFSLKFKVRQLE